jgi:hypothetical protein
MSDSVKPAMNEAISRRGFMASAAASTAWAILPGPALGAAESKTAVVNAGATAEIKDAGKKLAIQFGDEYQRRAVGYELISRVYWNPYYLWIDQVSDDAGINVDEAELEGRTGYGQPAEFRLGLINGVYHFTLTFHDPDGDHGPFFVKADDKEVLSGITVHAGEVRREEFSCEVRNNRIGLHFIPTEEKDFILNTLEIERVERVRLTPLFKTAPPIVLPTKEELHQKAQNDPKAALRRICDWIIAHAHPDGYLGDVWDGNVFYWYTMSFPVRALLAGYDIFGDSKYLDAAAKTLDLFVGEQLAGGSWTDDYRKKLTSDMSSEELQKILKTHGQGLSGNGSAVGAMAAASRYVDGPRKEKYAKAVCRFCDEFASTFQRESGAFNDGYNGTTRDGDIFSCATAIEASVFSLAYATTGDAKYIQVADRAMDFLLPYWVEDGRMVGRAPHWYPRNRNSKLMETLWFGDQWYYDDGFITVFHHTKNSALRDKINFALRRRALGSHGLLAAVVDRVWWPIQNIWLNAKSIGEVQTLLHAQRHGKKNDELDRTIDNMVQFLSAPEYARRVGIMADDAEYPASEHHCRTWSGMGMEATGFAGMSLAEKIKPGVLYLK